MNTIHRTTSLKAHHTASHEAPTTTAQPASPKGAAAGLGLQGLPSRTSSSHAVAPRNMLSLPGELHRSIGKRLPITSMVAFAATSKSTQSAMQESAIYQHAATALPLALRAHSAADFDAALQALNLIPGSAAQTESRTALMERFVNRHAAIPVTAALEVRSSLIGSLGSVPASPTSAQELAPGVMAAFDAIRAMTHRAHRLATDDTALDAVEPQDYARVFMESQSALDAVTPDHFALNEIVNKHGMAAHHGPMAQLMDQFFDGHSTPHAVQFATMMFPVRLAKLEPGSVSKEHVADLMARLAQHALGPSGVHTVDDPSWGEFTSGKIKSALAAHGIDPATHPELHAALASLEAGHWDLTRLHVRN